TLKSSLEKIESEIKDLGNDEQRLRETRGSINERMKGVREESVAAETVLEGESTDTINAAIDRFQEAFEDESGANSLAELRRKETGWTGSLNARVQESTERLRPAQTTLSKAMGRYLRPGSELLVRFPDWNSETTHLRDEISYLPEYENLLARLRDEDLPGYKDRFREYMNRRMSESLVGFSTLLDSADRSIETYIRGLNKSLKKLPYDRAQDTYIALNKEQNTDPVIREFRNLLRGSHPDQGRLAQDDIQELEAAFDRIRKLIERLEDDQIWRRKVLDVRNWSRFSAGEYFREDDSLKQYYEASGSLSGGEKAKLAYTILASALAYQYGLQADPVRSFRFIVVDEIFSKVDPQNAEYAMELFKNLNLQVMVVTPLDNIRLVEDHISTVHFAERGAGDLARIHDITIEDVRRRRTEREEG
ncbi:MAG: SbcC/MukB-like Walker B domain-containing protein, partial [Spirochaetaceae bacterium]|nr:SbcC/MukB-like Walker B domain-containing protein [Spirochaetaceae bacterium]